MNKKPDKKSATRESLKTSDAAKAPAKKTGSPKKAASEGRAAKSAAKTGTKSPPQPTATAKAGKPAESKSASAASGAKSAPLRNNGSSHATHAPSRSNGPSPMEPGPLEELTLAIIAPGSSPDKPLRAKSFMQFETQRPFGFPEQVPDLPRAYHLDKLVLMPKDPEWMFSYWEITAELVERKAREKRNAGEVYHEVMKINWDSRDLFETNFTFIPVHFGERKWWFKVPDSGQTYQIELGWLSDAGHFISIIASDPSEMPETWRKTRTRLEAGGEFLHQNVRAMHFGSSEHFVLEGRTGILDFFNPSSDVFSSSSPMAAAPARSDWTAQETLMLPAELDIKGKVRPGTTVRIDGREIATDTDGHFRVQLPVEKQSLQVTLTSESGKIESFLYNLKELTVC